MQGLWQELEQDEEWTGMLLHAQLYRPRLFKMKTGSVTQGAKTQGEIREGILEETLGARRGGVKFVRACGRKDTATRA